MRQWDNIWGMYVRPYSSLPPPQYKMIETIVRNISPIWADIEEKSLLNDIEMTNIIHSNEKIRTQQGLKNGSVNSPFSWTISSSA